MLLVKLDIAVFILLAMYSQIYAKPFLFNSTSFISSFLGASAATASSSSSSSDQYSQNIAKIPKNKPEKLIEDRNDNDDSFVFPDDTNANTEPPPTFVQRKVAKIIRKLVTLSQITNAIHGNNQPSDGEFQYTSFEDLDKDSETVEREPDVSEFERSNPLVAAIGTQYGQNLPKKVEQPPINLDVPKNVLVNLDNLNSTDFEYVASTLNNERQGKKFDFGPLKIDFNKKITDEDGFVQTKSNLQDLPGSIGLFFLEVFASLIGLTYGAAAQVNHVLTQNNTV